MGGHGVASHTRILLACALILGVATGAGRASPAWAKDSESKSGASFIPANPQATAAAESKPETEAVNAGSMADELISPDGESEDRAKQSIQALPAGYQPQPLLQPRQALQPETPLPPAASRIRPWLRPEEESGLGSVTPAAGSLTRDVVSGRDAAFRANTDAGNIFGDTPRVLGTGVQRRTPIVTDPRVRGSRVGQLAASGSYWVPARIDLDTVLSKIDSRLIEQMTVVKGPYSTLYGPGLDFIDLELLRSPRFENGPEAHGHTGFDYRTNGQQWYGRQGLSAGSQNWGARFDYGHRTGNDYLTGADADVPSSYKSRDMNLAAGFDPTPDTHVEYNGLRLDQTDVEYPGQIFDMNYLVTDGHEVRYLAENLRYCDRLAVDVWYNNTRFEGNAQNPGKRKQFPYLNRINYVGFTDVHSASSGFRIASTWGDDDCGQLTAGIDLRYLCQELNEYSSGRIGFNVFKNANSPLPLSQWTNPGIFVEQEVPVTDQLVITAGARADLVDAEVIDDPAKLAHLGIQQNSLANILGTDDFQQQFGSWAVFLAGDYQIDPAWSLHFAGGHGERPPSLTELYVAQSFLFLLENGENTATGDPRLRPEKSWQLDLGLTFERERFRAGINGFHAWLVDYITFENIGVVRTPPNAAVEQVNLKYVNTDLATLAGGEAFAQYDFNRWITPFATIRYVDGRDLTRDGDFATKPAGAGTSSVRTYGKSRGYYSGVSGAGEEPLPSILPLESRLGFFFHEPQPKPRWTVELAARVVDDQDRVATSLMELPTPGFTVWDLRGYWQATRNLLLLAGVENFTDKNFREHLDFHSATGISVDRPGITFYFGSELVY
jgi:outer membrane receptor protein involved in Fe transport